MKSKIFVLVWLFVVPTLFADSGCNLLITGAKVWTGAEFEPKKLAIADGRFIPVDSVECEQELALDGQFISPPFGEGHSHNIEAEWLFPSINERHLAEGVFYVLNLNAYPPAANNIRAQTERADTIDVGFAMGGLTSYHGHPEGVYVITLSRIMYGNAERDFFVGQAFHTVGTKQDIDQALDALVDQGADFVKIVLEGSEDFEARHAFVSDDDNWDQLVADIQGGELDDAELSQKMAQTSVGLDPSLVPEIVRRAHQRGLRVMAHVGTAHDFEVAIKAGVDAAAHLPGGYIGANETAEALRLGPEQIALARDAGAAVVATTNVRPEFIADDQRKVVHALQRDNVRGLLDAGVPVLIGTDRWNVTTFPEIEHLVNIGAMSVTEAFNAWIATSRFAFPDRRIGAIEPGFEADLLVFDQDPRTSLEALKAINLRIKAGQVLPDIQPDESE